MALEAPLDSDEERFWRALVRVVVALPKALDDDLLKAAAPDPRRGAGAALRRSCRLRRRDHDGASDLPDRVRAGVRRAPAQPGRAA
ncbi:hypothetical protein [Actinacidiphila glaucinigra]|uniref:hypothetical protein n=1 Tax=Actinacidiphila glaucinigra TaxID=235986 RepID=UPI002E3108CF|nr:hypothetical protein [Actinacidiphila glaucinigra]